MTEPHTYICRPGLPGQFLDDRRECGRQARTEAATTLLELSLLRRLRNAVVARTPLFETFIRRQATA